jgi:cycloeucalenol cycloisomerase
MKTSKSSLWLASNPSKRWAELFYLAYSPFWILWVLCILIPFQLYEVTRRHGARSGAALPPQH